MLRVSLLGAMANVVLGHGMMLLPTPRNALDRDLAMFANGSWPPGTATSSTWAPAAANQHP